MFDEKKLVKIVAEGLDLDDYNKAFKNPEERKAVK